MVSIFIIIVSALTLSTCSGGSVSKPLLIYLVLNCILNWMLVRLEICWQLLADLSESLVPMIIVSIVRIPSSMIPSISIWSSHRWVRAKWMCRSFCSPERILISRKSSLTYRHLVIGKIQTSTYQTLRRPDS